MAFLIIVVAILAIDAAQGQLDFLKPACVNNNATMKQDICNQAVGCGCNYADSNAPLYKVAMTTCMDLVLSFKGACDISHAIALEGQSGYSQCTSDATAAFCSESCNQCCETANPDCVSNCQQGLVANIVGKVCATFPEFGGK